MSSVTLRGSATGATDAPDRIVVAFPEVHADARIELVLNATVRVPDDESVADLPPSLGRLELWPTSAMSGPGVPEAWVHDPGVVVPLWQTEATWISFSCGYPFLVMVGAGAVNAITGEPWSPEPDFDRQNYLEAPDQPWLDGFPANPDEAAVGTVRQFVAAPLGRGYTAEEQLTDAPAVGGLTLVVAPLRAEHHVPVPDWEAMPLAPGSGPDGGPVMAFSAAPPPEALGLGGGGRIRQIVAEAEHPAGHWDLDAARTVRVHIADAESWERLTGRAPHPAPASAADYTAGGGVWFELEQDGAALDPTGSPVAGLESVGTVARRRGEVFPPEDEAVGPHPVIRIRRRPGGVSGEYRVDAGHPTGSGDGGGGHPAAARGD